MSFQPICVLCLGDCNRDGGITSCNHYFCSRCISRLPAAAPCPLCQRPYQLVKLDYPNAQQLLQDGATALERTEKLIISQVRHYQEVIRRMRQALVMLHGQHQDMRQKSQEKQAECATAVSQAQALQAEVFRLREDLARATAAVTRASSQRTTPQKQSQPPPPRQQQREHMFSDPQVAHASDRHPHGAPQTAKVYHTPTGQIIPPPLAGPHAPFTAASAVRARTLDSSPRGSWPRPSVASSPSLSSHAHGQYRRHHEHGSGGETRGAAVSETLTPSAVEVAPPLGWSETSLIAKRHRTDSNPVLPQRRVDDAHVTVPRSAASLGAGAKASPQQRPLHQSSHAFARQPRSGGGDSSGPSIDYWLTTRQAAALQQHPKQSRHPDSFMQTSTSHMPRLASKPLKGLFPSPRDTPKSF
ncbi:hypothetical protein, conserved [Leishmania tarentolae]|uniref:RING-type domain-containing protein n=1 Tax=Leishmania tarentolae TaxID=5689 RepID=A0A640KGL6_LEITA|nr:hypothetical protein, conserved [Leishmania tarentolae]